jgi:hypothetical protein
VSAETPVPNAMQAENEPGRRFDRKTVIPLLAILALIVVPIAIWAATSGGSGEKLRIDQAVSVYGGPEIVVNVPKKVNTMSETKGSSNVRLICEDGGGKTVLSANQDWPFINEPGYPYPHVHQPVTPKQLQAIARCHLVGTKTKLEGNLRRT